MKIEIQTPWENSDPLGPIVLHVESETRRISRKVVAQINYAEKDGHYCYYLVFSRYWLRSVSTHIEKYE